MIVNLSCRRIVRLYLPDAAALLTARALSGQSGSVVAQPPQFSAVQLDFFESTVRPLLIRHCYECHSAKKIKGSLSLRSRAAIVTGGDSGPAIVPGQPESSLLIRTSTMTVS